MLQIYRIGFLRRLVIPLLKMTGMDIRIKHPWVEGKKISLHSFKHKGYWWHGKDRECKTMSLFAQLTKCGGGCVEVGGHIGFVTMYFSHLVGPSGRVIVFEPGINNLPYIKNNVKGIENIHLVDCAVGSRIGASVFYEDSLTGQNNSMLKDFSGLQANVALSYVSSDVIERQVKITTIDGFFNKQTDQAKPLGLQVPERDPEFWGDRKIDLLKIDVEGFEYEVLAGAEKAIFTDKPVIMVEVQADHEKIFNFLQVQGYLMFNDSGSEHKSGKSLKGNVFCLNRMNHKDYLHLFRTTE